MGYRSDIDGLRALAVLSVVIFHLNPAWLPGGFAGVDVFFVISGYLITTLIVSGMAQQRFSFWNFYARRIKRIFPALFVVLLFCAAASVLIMMPYEYQFFFKGWKYAAQQISNFLFVRGVDYFSEGFSPSPVLHTWSLGVEEQFYLFWPLIIFLVAKYISLKRLPYVVASIIVVSLYLSEMELKASPRDAFYLLHSRAWELAVGALLACMPTKSMPKVYLEVAGVLGLVLLAYTFIMLEGGNNFPGLSAVAPCLGAALIIFSGSSADIKTLSHRLLSVKPMVFFGLISYSLYLWHWPLIIYSKLHFGSLTNTFLAVIFFGSVVLSYASWRFIETPFRRMASSRGIVLSADQRKKMDKRVIYTGLFVIALFTVASGLLAAQSHSGWRFRGDIKAHYSDWDDLLRSCNFGNRHAKKGEGPDSSCVVGAELQQYNAVLFGDSHAAHYLAVLDEWAVKNDASVRLLTSAGCPALFGDLNRIRVGQPIDYKCQAFSRSQESEILSDDNVKYVFLAMRLDLYTHIGWVRLVDSKNSEETLENSQRVFAEKLEYTIQKINEAGKIPVILGQVPLVTEDPVGCYLRPRTLMTAIFPREMKEGCFEFDVDTYNESLEYLFVLLAELKKKHDFAFFDPRPYLPSAEAGGYILYRDQDHLNEKGGRYLGRSFSIDSRVRPESLESK